MFRRLFRLLLTLVIVGGLLWYFAPHVVSGAANSLLNSLNNSTAQGMAVFVPPGTNSPNNSKGDLQINLTGLTPGASYDLHLDQAQCGNLSKDLGSVTADANGNAYIEIPLTGLDINQSWLVNVLQQGTSVACGTLQTNQAASSQVVNAAQNGPDYFGAQTTTQATPTTQPSQSQGNTATTPYLPNTGAQPGNSQQYDNNQYPRKY